MNDHKKKCLNEGIHYLRLAAERLAEFNDAEERESKRSIFAEAVMGRVTENWTKAPDPTIDNSRPLDLIVTLDGVPFEDQALGLRLFKEACGITTTRDSFTTAGVDFSGRSK